MKTYRVAPLSGTRPDDAPSEVEFFKRVSRLREETFPGPLPFSLGMKRSVIVIVGE